MYNSCNPPTIAVIYPHYHFWKNVMNHAMFLECRVAVTCPYFNYHHAHNAMACPSEECWWRGEDEGGHLGILRWSQGCGSSEDGDKSEPETEPSFIEVHAAFDCTRYHSFMRTTSANMMNRIFLSYNWSCFTWNVMFQQLTSKKLFLDRHFKVRFICSLF